MDVERSHPETEPISVSMVIPVNNEGQTLPILLRELRTATDSLLPRTVEVILVDDFSSDNTVAVLEAERAHWPGLRVIRLPKRSGQTMALAIGLGRSRGEFIATLDGDLQDDPGFIPKLLMHLESNNFDMVVGRRSRRHTTRTKRLFSRTMNWVVRRVTGVPVKDCACGLKVFRKDALGEVRLGRNAHRYLPALVHMTGRRVAELPVCDRPRKHGQSHYRVLHRLFAMLVDIPSIALGRYSTLPTRVLWSRCRQPVRDEQNGL